MTKKMAQRPPKVIEIQGAQYTVEELAWILAQISERGEWHEGRFWPIHISEWVEDGIYNGTETLQSLADEWDQENYCGV